MKFAAFSLIIAVCLSGCLASMSDILTAKQNGEGLTRVYDIDYDTAWEISKAVLRWEKTETIEEHKLEGYMLTFAGENLISEGTVMGAFFDVVDSQHTQVTFISKRKKTMQLVTDLPEGTYHKRFQQAVDILKSGQRLPIEAPSSYK